MADSSDCFFLFMSLKWKYLTCINEISICEDWFWEKHVVFAFPQRLCICLFSHGLFEFFYCCDGFFFFWQCKIRAVLPDTKAIRVSQGFCLGAFSVPLAALRWHSPNTIPTKVVTFSSFSQAAKFMLAMESQGTTVQVKGSSYFWSPWTWMTGFPPRATLEKMTLGGKIILQHFLTDQ